MQQPTYRRLRFVGAAVAVGLLAVGLFGCSSESTDEPDLVPVSPADGAETTVVESSTTASTTSATQPKKSADGRTLPKTQIQFEAPDDPEFAEAFDAYRNIQGVLLDDFLDPGGESLASEWLVSPVLGKHMESIAADVASHRRVRSDSTSRYSVQVIDAAFLPNGVRLTVCIFDGLVVESSETGELLNEEARTSAFVDTLELDASGLRWTTRDLAEGVSCDG